MTIRSLSEDTRVTVGVLIAIVCCTAWLSSVAFQSNANARDIKTVQDQMSAISAMQTDIAVIKLKVENIESTVNKEN